MSNIQPETTPSASPLTSLQRLGLGALYWSHVLFAGFAALASFWSSGRIEIDFWAGAAFVVGGFASVRIWKFIQKGKFRAGFMAGVLVTVSSFAFVAGLALGALDEEGWDGEEVDESHLSFGITSASGASDSRDGFAVCIDELHRRPSDRRSMRQEAIDVLRGTASPDLVESAVQDVMIAVCEKFGEGNVEGLRPYFFKSVHNQKGTLRRVRNKWQYCQVEEWHLPPQPPPDHEGIESLKLLQAAMCRLDARHAYAIRRKVDGKKHAWIAEQLDVSKAQSRRFVSDGRAELKRSMQEMRRR